MSKWIRVGSEVVVIAGNEKGKTGSVISRGKDRVIIQGVNMRKKHLKRRSQEEKSQIIDMEAPLHISNVRLCDKEGKPVKVSVSVDAKKKEKVLVYNDGKKKVTYRSVKKHVG